MSQTVTTHDVTMAADHLADLLTLLGAPCSAAVSLGSEMYGNSSTLRIKLKDTAVSGNAYITQVIQACGLNYYTQGPATLNNGWSAARSKRDTVAVLTALADRVGTFAAALAILTTGTTWADTPTVTVLLRDGMPGHLALPAARILDQPDTEA